MFRRRIAVALAAALALLGLAACGGHHKQPAHKPVAKIPTLSQACPANRAVMGCSLRARPHPSGPSQPPTLGHPLFPDVSVWQKTVDWPAVAAWQRAHGWHPLAIWKLGEYRVDPYARRNASETARLGFFRVGYWFDRNTGCAQEAAQIIAEAKAEGLTAVAEDNEVPEARGYAACITPRLHAAGLLTIEYTSPGTNPDTANPGVQYEWVAAYGPSSPPCLFTCSVGILSAPQTIVAWQCTNGQVGCVTNVPGIGRDDVSIDYALSTLLAPHVNPDPLHYAVLTPLERSWALRYDGARKHPAQYAGYLKGVLEPELGSLAHAIWTVAHTPGQGGWTVRNRGERFQQTYRRSLGQQLAQ